MPWYKNTLFVIVADHPAQSVMVSEKEKVKARGESLSKQQSDYYKNTSGRYAIPMMLFVPGDTAMIAVDSRTAQQTDLAPTILDYLNLKDTVVAFGQSLLNHESPRLAVQSVSGLMQITSGKYSLLFDKENATALFDNLADPEHKHNLLMQQPAVADSLGQQLKALYQQYTKRLVNNKLEEAMIE